MPASADGKTLHRHATFGDIRAVHMLGALAFAVGFAVVTASVVAPGSPLPRIESEWMTAISRRRTDLVDDVVGPLSMLATQEPLTVQSLVAVVMIALTLGSAATAHFLVAAVGSGIVNVIVKRAIGRPRPPGPHLIPWFHSSSYPSGDMLTGTAIYLTIAMIAAPHFAERTACVAVFTIVPALMVLLGACRVYAGIHHPSDVLGGILLGASWAFFVSAWFA